MSAVPRSSVIVLFLALVVSGVLVACAMRSGESHGSQVRLAQTDASATFPPGPEGDLVAYGYKLLDDTPHYAGRFITARMSCDACHPHGGTQPHAGSFIGTYAKFPQWNRRANRFILLQDRIAECFLYSMNGHPPPYYSHEMVAIAAYIAWRSRGAPTGDGLPDQDRVAIPGNLKADKQHGAGIYETRCAKCHGANGDGQGFVYPPLWGPHSFNDRAGMAQREHGMAPFVRVAMPLDAPGTLSDQDALDVAAFVLSHKRPHFNKTRSINFPGEKAGYF